MADRDGDGSVHTTQPPSPATSRRLHPQNRHQSSLDPDEQTPLLRTSRSRIRIHAGAVSPRVPRLSRNNSSMGQNPHHIRNPSWGQRLIHALSDRQESTSESKGSLFPDERVWYDQFTSTDWVHDTIADSHRVKALRARKDFWGRVRVVFDGSQGWILSALVGFVVALIAYVVNVSESTVFDWKDGYCSSAWYLDEKVSWPPCESLLQRANSTRNAVPKDLAKIGNRGPRLLITTRLERMPPNSLSTSLESSGSHSSPAG
jgi:chloride channel 3/4/5